MAIYPLASQPLALFIPVPTTPGTPVWPPTGITYRGRRRVAAPRRGRFLPAVSGGLAPTPPAVWRPAVTTPGVRSTRMLLPVRRGAFVAVPVPPPAPGTVLSAVIGADGWWADVTIAGMSTGGTYSLGLGPNSDPATGTPTVNVSTTSLGFTTTGAPATVARTLYGTKPVRQPYPNATLNQETTSGANVTVRVALAGYVFAKDVSGAGNSGVDPTLTIAAGVYTQSGVPSLAATNVPVANNSTRAYPQVVGNWSWPGYDKLGSTFPLRAVAYHASAASGRPVQCVIFTATDGTNTATTTVSAASVDSTVGDDTPVVEYVATMNASALTQGAVVTCNFVAYPRIGDTAACLDTSLGAAQPSPLVGPVTAVCDKAGTYATSVAVVDPVSGNDGTGVVTASFSTGSPPAAYLTMAAAFNALRTYNNTNYSRNNCGGSIMYLKDGTHPWVNGSVTLGTTPSAWLTIAKYPTSTRSNVIVGNFVTGHSLGLKVKLQDVLITGQSSSGNISAGAGSWLWVDRCEINAPTSGQPPFYINTVWHLTRCLVTNLAGGIRPFSTVNAAPAIVRGNTVVALETGKEILAYTLIGNSVPASAPVFDFYTGMTAPTSVNTVVAYNRISGALGSNASLLLRQSTTDTVGLAMVQNLVENTTSTTVAAVQIAADATTQTPVNNALIWNNVVVGQRTNIAYNESDVGGLAVRLGWSIKNNVFDDANTKSDTFAGAGFLASGAKVGNWSMLYGTGCSGNLYLEITGISTTSGSFLWELPGLKSIQPVTSGQPPTGSANPLGYAQFVNRQSYNGSTTGAGGGDYHFAPTAPGAGLQRDWLIPFDLAGVARNPSDAVGVYSFVAALAGPPVPSGAVSPVRTRRLGPARRGQFLAVPLVGLAPPVVWPPRAITPPRVSVVAATRRGVFQPRVHLVAGVSGVLSRLRRANRIALPTRRGQFLVVALPAPVVTTVGVAFQRMPRHAVAAVPVRRGRFAPTPLPVVVVVATVPPPALAARPSRWSTGLPARRGAHRARPWIDTVTPTPGSILGVAVGADGWWADITIAGLSTGGAYSFGLGTNNDPAAGTPAVVFTVVSLGFDNTGAPTTVTRTIYGTKQVRQPYPNAALNQETVSGGNVTVRVALSDYIYAKDATGGGNSGTAPTATFSTGFYTQGIPNVAATNVTVTNNSTHAYPKVVGNWSWPGNEKLGSAFTVRAVAYHRSASAGHPVQCVKFTATDTHSVTATTTVTAPVVDSSVGDAVAVVEYVAAMDGSGLTQGDVVTCNFVAYPAVGDTAACLDTTAGTAAPTPLYGPVTAVCDKTGAYATSVAVVDPVSGNDGTGTVTASFSVGSPPPAYLTMAAAFNALRTFNNTNYGRNNCGGSTMYLRDGTHPWVNGTVTLGTTPDTWLTIAKYPTSSRGNVIIGAFVTGHSLGLKVKIQDVLITGQSASGNISAGAGSWLWTDRCEFNAPVANQPAVYINTVWYTTRCLVTSLAQGFRPFSTVNTASAIVRGNTVVSTGAGPIPYTMLGNALPASSPMVDAYAGQTIPTAANTVVCYNRISGAIGSAAPVALRMNATTETHGVALIQNVIEVTASSVQAALQISADSSTGTPVNNVMIWNNVVVGQRVNIAYNEVDPASGGGLAVRLGWSVRNNIFDDNNIKSDTFAGSGFVADATKVGNWSLLYGCSCSGDLNAETAGVSTASGNFLWEFLGVKSIQPAVSGQPPAGSTNAIGYIQFAGRQSYNGTTTGLGGGNYHLQAGSPAAGLQQDRLIPFDLAGVGRQTTDAAGAYALIPLTTPTPVVPRRTVPTSLGVRRGRFITLVPTAVIVAPSIAPVFLRQRKTATPQLAQRCRFANVISVPVATRTPDQIYRRRASSAQLTRRPQFRTPFTAPPPAGPQALTPTGPMSRRIKHPPVALRGRFQARIDASTSPVPVTTRGVMSPVDR